jgi:hypothetical protein
MPLLNFCDREFGTNEQAIVVESFRRVIFNRPRAKSFCIGTVFLFYSANVSCFVSANVPGLIIC